MFGPGLRKYRLKFQAPIDRTVAIRDNFSTMNLDSDDERVTLQFKVSPWALPEFVASTKMPQLDDTLLSHCIVHRF